MSPDFIISAFVTLLVVVDPIGLAPAFIGITHGLDAPARRSVAVRAAPVAAVILIGTALSGDPLLRRLGITLPAFQIAGAAAVLDRGGDGLRHPQRA